MLTLVEAPATLPLTLAEVKAAARLDGLDDDALITAYLRSAVASIDGRDGWLGRCLIEQTWALSLDEFPLLICVPLPPLIEVVSISYVDSAGESQTLDPSAYQVSGTDPAIIVPAHGQRWPATRCQPGAVGVEYRAGYGDHNAVPEPIREALMLMVASSYDGCTSQAAKEMLFQFRAWS